MDSIGQSVGLVTYYEEGEFFYLERGDRVDEKKLLKDDSLQQGIDEESIIQLLNYFVNHRDLHAVNTNYLCFTLWEFDDFKLKELKQNEECGSVNAASEEMVWGNFELID